MYDLLTHESRDTPKFGFCGACVTVPCHFRLSYAVPRNKGEKERDMFRFCFVRVVLVLLGAMVLFAGVAEAEPVLKVSDFVDLPGMRASFSGSNSPEQDTGIGDFNFRTNDRITSVWAGMRPYYIEPTNHYSLQFLVEGIVGDDTPIVDYDQHVFVNKGGVRLQRSLSAYNTYAADGSEIWIGSGANGRFFLPRFQINSGNMSYREEYDEWKEITIFVLDIQFVGEFLGDEVPQIAVGAEPIGFSVTPVPEPSGMLLFASAIASCVAFLRRRFL